MRSVYRRLAHCLCESSSKYLNEWKTPNTFWIPFSKLFFVFSSHFFISLFGSSFYSTTTKIWIIFFLSFFFFKLIIVCVYLQTFFSISNLINWFSYVLRQAYAVQQAVWLQCFIFISFLFLIILKVKWKIILHKTL